MSRSQNGRRWAWAGTIAVVLVFLGFLGRGLRVEPDLVEREAPPDRALAPLFEIELPPGEGRPVFQSTGEPLELREAPDLEAAREGLFQISEGAEVEWDEARYRTIEAGTAEALRAVTVSGRDLGGLRDLSREDYYLGGFPEGEWELAPGDRLEVLQHRAEGTCFVRIGETVVDATFCPTHLPEAFAVLDEPVTELWIRVLEAGEPAGWALVEERTLRLVDRRFGVPAEEPS